MIMDSYIKISQDYRGRIFVTVFVSRNFEVGSK